MKYLNATCVQVATANFTHFDSGSGGNLTACTIKPPTKVDFHGDWFFFAYAVVSTIFFALVIGVSHGMGVRKVVHWLRNRPSHQLHRELEQLYRDTLFRKEKQDLEDRVGVGRGRYSSVAFTTDEYRRRRYIAIIEDLDKVPTEEELKRFRKEFERKRKAFEVQAEPATELPPLTVPYFDVRNDFRQPSIISSTLDTEIPGSNYVAAPQPAFVNGNQGGVDQGRSEIHASDTAPPPYRHVWSEHV